MCNIKPKNIVEDTQHHSNIKIKKHSKNLSKNKRHDRLTSESKSRSRSRSKSAGRTISLKQMKNANKSKEYSNDVMANLTRTLIANQTTNSEVIDLVKKTIQTKTKDTNKKTEAKEGDIKSVKEDKMPILEPQVDVIFTSNSDRDDSRSPPLITSQETVDLPASPKEELLKLDISERSVKSKTSKLHSDGTVAEIVRDLAFHEKVKH